MANLTWPADWGERRKGIGCPACMEGRPDRLPHGDRFFAGTTSDAYLTREPRVRGYALLLWRGRHVSELTELQAHELSSFTAELVAVCRAIETLFLPAKLNLLALGNSLPHLHVHIIPRYVDDPDPGRPPIFLMDATEQTPIDETAHLDQLAALRDLLER